MQAITRLAVAHIFKPLTLSLLLTCSLTACNGESRSSTGGPSATRSVTDTGNSTGNSGGSTGSSTPVSTPTVVKTYTRDADYPGMVTLPLQFLTTSNGKKLAVSVTLPADEKGVAISGSFPTILVQTAYNISLDSVASGTLPKGAGALVAAPDSYMVQRGYVIVAVDTVGTGASDGGWEMLGEEEQAGYGDTVDWVLKQSWSNGKLGVAGASYMAITALFSAERRPDAIQAVFASVPLGDAYRGTVSTGGMLNGVFMSTWLTLTATLTKQNGASMAKYPEYKDQIMAATNEHIAQIDNYYLPIINKALAGDAEITYHSDFWSTRSPLENIDKIKAPTFILGATNDIFQRDEPLLYEALKKNNVDTRLVIYDGDHVSHFLQMLSGNEKVQPGSNLMLQWFDNYLKGMNTGVEKIPPVTQFVKGYSDDNVSKAFSNSTAWPHSKAVAERWYLHGDMTLTKIAPTGDEETHAMAAPEFEEITAKKTTGGILGTMLNFVVKPKDGTRCSISLRQWTLGIASATNPTLCYADDTELEADALNFETAPLDENYYINGPIQADIWVDTTVTEAVVSVRVDEVAGDGSFVKPLTNGLLLASARAVDESKSRYLNNEMVQPYHPFTQDAEMPVVPGVAMKMQVEIFPTSALIRAGNKLRISIAPSNEAQGVLNTPRKEQAKGGITTIHSSQAFPSSVVLPTVPLSELN